MQVSNDNSSFLTFQQTDITVNYAPDCLLFLYILYHIKYTMSNLFLLPNDFFRLGIVSNLCLGTESELPPYRLGMLPLAHRLPTEARPNLHHPYQTLTSKNTNRESVHSKNETLKNSKTRAGKFYFLSLLLLTKNKKTVALLILRNAVGFPARLQLFSIFY